MFHAWSSFRGLVLVSLYFAGGLSSGCVHTDTCQTSIRLRNVSASNPGQNVSVEGGTLCEEPKEIVVGMTKAEIREIAGAMLEETSEYMWTIHDQYVLFTPGVYPYFDSRKTYLYFDRGDEKLTIIVVRGDYWVYP